MMSRHVRVLTAGPNRVHMALGFHLRWWAELSGWWPPPDGTLSFLFWLFIARVESSNIKSSSSSSAEKCLFVCRVRILLLENKRAISITKKTIDDAQHVHTIFDTFYIRFSADDETGWDNAHHSFGMTHFEFIKRTQGRCKCCTNLSTFSGCWSFQLIQLLVIPRWRYSSLWTD